MHPMPKPDLLDPDRMKSADRDDASAREHRTRDQMMDQALRESCEYATELWQHLDATRKYLFDSLPSDPRAPGTNPHSCASPTGPTDEVGWQSWIETYATATAILAGPHGDSGFGLGEAREAARIRRDAPNLRVLAATNPNVPSPEPAASPVKPPRPSALRTVGMAVVALLALRGLRRRTTL
jgi:hypothetical protein